MDHVDQPRRVPPEQQGVDSNSSSFLFAILCYFMLLRVKGSSDELSPRLVVHMGLALSLAPLLFIKVVVARYQKAARGLLMALGIGIFAIAFTLVTLNVSIHYLRLASPHKVPRGTSLTVVVLALVSVGIAYFRNSKQPKPKPDTGVFSLRKPAAQELSNPGEALNLTLARIESQTHDAKTLRFLLPRGGHLGARPGQFLTFEWAIDGRPVTRSYSISSSPVQTATSRSPPSGSKTAASLSFLMTAQTWD